MSKISSMSSAVGIVVTCIVMLLVTVAVMYVSYILAIGVFLSLVTYVVYKLLRVKDSLKESP